jgi:micrococcal nuclease
MKTKIYFLIVFLLLIAGCATGERSAEFFVSKVIDGDTIQLSNGKSVRYIGIDTPELRRKSGGIWIYEPEEYALEAKEANRKLVEGRKVTLEFDLVKTDKYGRWLAYVFINGKMINEELLGSGYAMLYTYPPNLKYTDRLVAAQKKAREEKKGFWKSYQIITPDQAAGHIGEFYTVKGLVKSTFSSPKATFLNFGQNWREDFTAVIFKSNLNFFKKKGINPAVYYKDKQVEITGRIKFYNGPEIVINHPSQIRIAE